jgi:hypothetical protein
VDGGHFGSSISNDECQLKFVCMLIVCNSTFGCVFSLLKYCILAERSGRIPCLRPPWLTILATGNGVYS